MSLTVYTPKMLVVDPNFPKMGDGAKAGHLLRYRGSRSAPSNDAMRAL